MSKTFVLSLSYLSLCKFFWTRTENRVIENRVMENRVKRGITVYDFILLGTFFLCQYMFATAVPYNTLLYQSYKFPQISRILWAV